MFQVNLFIHSDSFVMFVRHVTFDNKILNVFDQDVLLHFVCVRVRCIRLGLCKFSFHLIFYYIDKTRIWWRTWRMQTYFEQPKVRLSFSNIIFEYNFELSSSNICISWIISTIVSSLCLTTYEYVRLPKHFWRNFLNSNEHVPPSLLCPWLDCIFSRGWVFVPHFLCGFEDQQMVSSPNCDFFSARQGIIFQSFSSCSLHFRVVYVDFFMSNERSRARGRPSTELNGSAYTLLTREAVNSAQAKTGIRIF